MVAAQYYTLHGEAESFEGGRKTAQKLLGHFFWSGMFKKHAEVVASVRSQLGLSLQCPIEMLNHTIGLGVVSLMLSILNSSFMSPDLKFESWSVRNSWGMPKACAALESE